MADYNRRFAKEPLHDFNAYRPLALDDDLDAEFTGESLAGYQKI